MRIWGISDTHLAEHKTDSMTYYGPIWVKHREKIIENWHSKVKTVDTVLVGGDITWAYDIKKALIDINMLDSLPGRQKFLVKGNHDVWWKSLAEVNRVMPKSTTALSGTAQKADGHVFCGTMGWLAPGDSSFDNLDMNFFQKEMALLEKALKAAVELKPEKGLHLLLHFPPFTTEGRETPFFDLISKYPVTTCSFGHFHFKAEWDSLPQGKIGETEYRLIATDYLEHKPYLIWDD
ncbi:MAG: metallophosphoesterase [Proteobacteria bacterium]|nr:metallophosphoesterase [Pseudomonadota bacterium]